MAGLDGAFTTRDIVASQVNRARSVLPDIVKCLISLGHDTGVFNCGVIDADVP